MRIVLSTILFVTLAFASFAGGVKPTSTCVSELVTLTQGYAAANPTKDANTLLTKALEAVAKLAEDKNADALLKLNDFDVKLAALEATIGTRKAKITAEDAGALRAELAEAIACASAL